MRIHWIVACGVLAAFDATAAVDVTEACVAEVGDPATTVALTGFSAWRGDALAPVLAALGVDRARVQSISCEREPLELGPHDWMLPQSGLGLTLRHGPDPTHLVLGMRRGEMVASVVGGTLTPEQSRKIALALNGYAAHAVPMSAREKTVVAPGPSPRAALRRPEGSEDELCAALGCQENIEIRLRQADGTLFERHFARFPHFFQAGSPVVLPGQALRFEATPDGDRLALRRLDGAGDPKRTISVELSQMEDGGMLLHLVNPFDRRVKFSLALLQLDAEQLERTSSCPVIAGGFAQEIWPYPILQIVLLDARLLGDDESVGCVD